MVRRVMRSAELFLLCSFHFYKKGVQLSRSDILSGVFDRIGPKHISSSVFNILCLSVGSGESDFTAANNIKDGSGMVAHASLSPGLLSYSSTRTFALFSLSLKAWGATFTGSCALADIVAKTNAATDESFQKQMLLKPPSNF